MKRLNKRVLTMIMSVMAVLAMSIPAFAEEAGTANAQVVARCTTLASDMIATGAAVVPLALSVVGMLLVVRYGIKVFNSISHK